MSNSQVTLNQFFFLNAEELSEKELCVVESEGQTESLRKAVSKEVKHIKWPGIFSEIAKKIEELLDIDIPDIMVKAWAKYKTLLKYTDREKYPPDQTVLVPLVEHKIESEHHPHIDIVIDDKPFAKIEFQINIELTLKGMVLKIQDGKIKEVKMGSCEGKGSIKCGESVILEKEMEPFSLPSSIDLGDGIPIKP
jgi:hypothetical protein